MLGLKEQLAVLSEKQQHATLKVQTLGRFSVQRNSLLLVDKDWGREKSIQLFQYLLTIRHRNAQHKEQIIDRLWEDEGDDKTFKVAMHGINKALEPNRERRADPRYIMRQGITYELKLENIWVDADALEGYISIGNQLKKNEPELAIRAYRHALDLYQGDFLPSRLYEDWTSDERERLQVLALGAFITLGELVVGDNPMESVRLAQKALQIDATWEDAYRLEMQAYFNKGNRPMAIKSYRHCERVLSEEFGIAPLPATRQLMAKIEGV